MDPGVRCYLLQSGKRMGNNQNYSLTSTIRGKQVMPAKSNRLLMLLIGAAISGCASQTDRSSSSGNDRYQPEKESVQIVDRPLENAPPPKPAPAATAAPKNEAVAEFPITKYELPEEQDEPVEDLGPQDDDSTSAAQEA